MNDLFPDEKRAAEQLYQQYRKDRDDGMAHDQIVADGVYGPEAEAFALRYSLAQSAYVDAMVQQEKLHRAIGKPQAYELSPYGHTYRAGQ